MSMPRAEIFTMKCRNGGLVGLRTEERGPGNWVVNWRFPIDRQAPSYSAASTEVKGSFSVDGDLDKACARCESTGFVKCGSCSELTCFEGGEGDMFTCAWCGEGGPVGGFIESLSSQGDV